MSIIPENEVTQNDLQTWFKLDEEIRKLKTAEVLLRQKIFKGKFPNPVEGTNTTPLNEGWVLKGKRTINRTIDIGALNALREQFATRGINADSMINYKPELKVAEYRKLTAEQLNLFDQALIIKDGMPALEIMLPKKAS